MSSFARSVFCQNHFKEVSKAMHINGLEKFEYSSVLSMKCVCLINTSSGRYTKMKC